MSAQQSTSDAFTEACENNLKIILRFNAEDGTCKGKFSLA